MTVYLDKSKTEHLTEDNIDAFSEFIYRNLNQDGYAVLYDDGSFRKVPRGEYRKEKKQRHITYAITLKDRATLDCCKRFGCKPWNKKKYPYKGNKDYEYYDDWKNQKGLWNNEGYLNDIEQLFVYRAVKIKIIDELGLEWVDPFTGTEYPKAESC